MKKLEAEATRILKAHGYDENGLRKKPRQKGEKPAVFVRFVSVPMGGMNRRYR